VGAVKRGVRNTFRNSIRTVGIVLILSIAVALSVSMLVARDGVNKKIASVRANTGTTITVAPAGSFGFFNSSVLTANDVTKLHAIDNVSKIVESLSPSLTSNSSDISLTAPSFGGSSGAPTGGGFGGGGSFLRTVRIIGTNSPSTVLVGGANNGSTESLTAGKSFASDSTANVAIVGTQLATANNLVVGSTFTAWSKTFTVVGIYNAGSDFANADVLMPLATVQKLSDSTGEISSAVVYANTIGVVPSVESDIRTSLGSSVDVTSQQSTVEAQIEPLNSVETIATYTLIGTVIGGGLILLLTMLMIVRERRREVGVLKAIGAPNRSVISQFVAESTTFTLMGAALGFLLGMVVASPITNAINNAVSNSSSSTGPGGFIRPGGGGFRPPSNGGFHFSGRGFTNTLHQIHVAVGWSTLVFALGIAVAIAVIGSSVAAATIVRIRPAEVLRSE
jgi:putative ABC transport system permease protein